jgi:NAD(P) transhydrogenase
MTVVDKKMQPQGSSHQQGATASGAGPKPSTGGGGGDGAAPQYDFELVVIGGGPAGEKGAAQAAYFDHKTCLVEKYHELGGACINWGTLASKTLRESALFLSGFRTRQLGEGMQVDFKANVDLRNFMTRKNLVQRREQERASNNMGWHEVTRVQGDARVADAHTVVVKGPDGQEKRITAKYILIATGSVPARPKTIPFNENSVFDSTTVLDMKTLPKSMVVVGGGVIGSEYACLFAYLGVKTYLVHPKARALDSLLDAQIGEIFMKRMADAGIELCMNDGVESCTTDAAGKVTTKLKSGKELVTDTMLYALGRSGNTEGLGLRELGLPIGKYGHVEKVDPITYQTVVPNVYAAGDVIGAPALASTSMEQGRLAMCHAFNIKYKTKLAPLLPAGIYTIPEISQVGMTEQDCQKAGIPYVVGTDRYGRHGRGQIIGDTDGMIKLIFNSLSGKLLGVHVIGEIASELVHIGMACMQYEGDIDFFIHTVFNYPTLSDVYKYAAYDALGKLNKVRDGLKDTATRLSNEAMRAPAHA